MTRENLGNLMRRQNQLLKRLCRTINTLNNRVGVIEAIMPDRPSTTKQHMVIVNKERTLKDIGITKLSRTVGIVKLGFKEAHEYIEELNTQIRRGQSYNGENEEE